MQTGAALSAAAQVSKGSPNGKITVGMIGAGARAHQLMEQLQKRPEQAEIVAIVDAYTGRVARALERTGGRAKAYKNYHDLLADKSIDAVCIATPDHWHRRMILDALAAGKDVYAEKPMTYTSSEGVEIVKLARAGGRILQVGSHGVSGDPARKAKEMIASGKLGKVTMIRSSYNRNTASGAWIYPIPPDASAKTVDWDAFLGPAPKRPFSLERFFRWRCYEDYSGGIATDLFVHLCTFIHYIMDAKAPSAVMAMGELYRWKESREVPDTVNAVLEYPEGFTVSLGSSFNTAFSSGAGFEVLGTEGALTITGAGLGFYPENAREDNRWILASWPSGLAEAYYKDPKVIAAEVADRPAAPPLQIKDDGPDATLAHVSNFLDAVRTRKPHWEDALAGHHAAACAHMINLSAKKRRLVEWDFAKDDIKA